MANRFDSVGLFWQDVDTGGSRRKFARVMPPIPDTGWTPPREFPNLSAAKVLSVDVETYDPELAEKGPGWARGKGHIVGVSIGTEDGRRWYFPMRHEVEPEMNLDPAKVLDWLRDTLSDPKQPKVGANIIYDIGWLRHEGVAVAGELVDVQYAEALLDESADVNLEALGQKYLGEGKQSSLLYDWCSQYYGGPATSIQRRNIYRAPPRLVGPYAESDADLPLRVAKAMYPHLVREGLYDLFVMECSLIPLLIEMRFQGVSVDLKAAEQLYERLLNMAREEKEKLRHLVGFEVNVNANDSLAQAFRCLGLPFNLTANGKPSFTKEFLKTVDHPIGEIIRSIREYEKLANTFVKSYILESHVNGKVYGQFHPLRGDGGGTRSGRFSSSNPNLQNIPARSELGRLLRTLFVPDPGHVAWRKYDYSQIEFRFLVHFAEGPGADEARLRYWNDPDTDYHDMTMELIAPWAGWDLSTAEAREKYRRPTKDINFGLAYGMGVPTLAKRLGLSPREGKALFDAYHKAVPFVKALIDSCMREAQATGVITTYLGRKSRFDLWEPMDWNQNTTPLPYDQAIRRWGGPIRRAYTHKALNRRLQGSAADLMKVAMLKCYQDGIFAETGVPRLTVHDELDFSDPGGKDEAFREMKHVLETALKLRVPVRADGEIGPNWGDVKPLPEAT